MWISIMGPEREALFRRVLKKLVEVLLIVILFSNRAFIGLQKATTFRDRVYQNNLTRMKNKFNFISLIIKEQVI